MKVVVKVFEAMLPKAKFIVDVSLATLPYKNNVKPTIAKNKLEMKVKTPSRIIFAFLLTSYPSLRSCNVSGFRFQIPKSAS